MAKLLASEASWAAADMCVQTHGGFGFAEDYDVERKGSDSDGNERVRLVPKSESGAEVFQTIIRPAKARKPPPPPRRKKRRGRGKRKGGRSR